jgi:DNA (cytosine-5)-methyltransferase 1
MSHSNNIEMVSLFSGCGGLDLGFEQAGFDIVWANEYNKKIWDTYEHNHPNTKLDRRSIVDIDSKEIYEADGIIGGPPCQSWSLAGSMDGIDDNRGKLFYEYLRVLRDKKPMFFLAENVPGIVSKTHIDEFMKIVELFENTGYEVSYKKLNSSHYGVPQSRNRVFIIGYRKDLGIKFDFNNIKKRKKVTLKDVLVDLPEPLPAKEKNYTNGDDLDINGHEYYIGDFSSRFMSRNRRRGWDEVAYTVEASGRHAKIHPSAGPMEKIEKDKWKFDESKPHRRLSIRESARIQTFPDDFEFIYEKLNDGYKMIGNAVPVELARVLARQIMKDLKSVDIVEKKVS